MIRVEYEHEVQRLAPAFLRAVAADDAEGIWALLSRESRGLLEGRFAARSGIPLQQAAPSGGGRLRETVAPLRESALAALGGPERISGFGVSAVRVVDRQTAYVLLLPDFGEERIVAEADWRPSHLLAFVREGGYPPGGSKAWLVDVGRTASLSSEARLPDPLGAVV